MSLLLLQYPLNLSGISRALRVGGDEFDLLGTIHAQIQLHCAGDLFLLEDGPLADGWRGAEIAQDGHTDGINGHAVCAGQDDLGGDPFAPTWPAIHEGFDAIQYDQSGLIGDVDLGDHVSLMGRTVQFAHVVVALSRHRFGNQPDGVLERQGEVSAIGCRCG